MSKELPSKPNNNEEVDLIVFFNLIGNVFSKIINFFKDILIAIFSSIIHALKVLFESWKLILGIMLIAGLAGYFLEKTKPTTYSTSMLVEPYFNSKYQLVNNIDYFNALISNNDYEALKDIFNVDDSVVDDISGFSIEPGPETENDRLLQYETFISKMDSVRAQAYPYEDFIENRSVYSGRYFLVKAYSPKSDIFKSLEAGVLSSFTNDYSDKEMRRRDTLIDIQRQNLQNQLKQVDSLKQIYIKVLQTESSSNKNGISLGTEFSLTGGGDKQKTREYDLLREEQRIRNTLNQLEEKKIEEDVVFDVISSFQKVGNSSKNWKERYRFLFPILSFLLLMFYFVARKVINFTLEYEN